MRRRRSHKTSRAPFIACSRCADRLLIEERVVNGRWERVAVRCACVRIWLAQLKAPAAPPVERERKDLA
jgi:Probable zinc-ribbon domain